MTDRLICGHFVLVQPLRDGNGAVFKSLTELVEGAEFHSWLEAAPHDREAVLRRLTPRGGNAEVLIDCEPRFCCNCSRRKVDWVLRLLDPAEQRDLIDHEGRADVNCHFCAASYTFSKSELEMMLGQGQSGHA